MAGSAEQLFEAYLREVGPGGLQAVAYADGHFIIRTGGINTPEAAATEAPAPGSPAQAALPAPGKISPADFVSRYANVELEKGSPIKTEEDVFGGQGYVVDSMTICSAGFAAFDPAGLPLLLTAGHCAEDGTAANADVEPATAAPAGGATTGLPAILKRLGTFGFSQFGGPNNSPITGSEANPGNIGTDIAVIKGVRPGINLEPSALTWANMAHPERTSVKIIGTTSPYQGQAVCRSGRTEGWSCGTVAETGIYVAAGRPASGTSCTDVGGLTVSPCDLRAFKGFLSYDVQSGGGDSGGPWISGNFAVGTHSAGEPQGAPQNFAVATTLEDALGYVPGPVRLQLFLNKPELAGIPAAGTVAPGSVIRGQVPAAPASGVASGSKVRLARAGQSPVEVPVDAAGRWSFRAPAEAGSFAFTAETVNGYSRSGTATFSIDVSGLAAPIITAPAAGATVPALDRIEGTGRPGSTVTISGDASGSATVGPDGHWSVSVGGQRTYGKLSVSAVQGSTGQPDSPAAGLMVKVRPPAPELARDWQGAAFGQDSLPEAISGSGVDGAEINVLVDGVAAGSARTGGAGAGTKAVLPSLAPRVHVADGRWSVPFPGGLASGEHTLEVSQSVDGVASKRLDLAFSIGAVAVAGPSATAVPAASAGSGAGTLSQPAGAVRKGAGFPAGDPGAGDRAAGDSGTGDPVADAVKPAEPPAAPASGPVADAVKPAEPPAAAASGPAAAAEGPAAPADAAAVPPAPTVVAGPGQLPNTGAGSLLPLAGLAGGAVLLGVFLLLGARLAARRRRLG